MRIPQGPSKSLLQCTGCPGRIASSISAREPASRAPSATVILPCSHKPLCYPPDYRKAIIGGLTP